MPADARTVNGGDKFNFYPSAEAPLTLDTSEDLQGRKILLNAAYPESGTPIAQP